MRLGEKVWYCKSIPLENQTDGQEYEKPIAITLSLHHFTVMNKTYSYKISEYIGELGEKNFSNLTAIAQPYEKWVGEFKKGDLFYCDGAKPSKSEEWYGQDANYIVKQVENGNVLIKLSLVEITG